MSVPVNRELKIAAYGERQSQRLRERLRVGALAGMGALAGTNGRWPKGIENRRLRGKAKAKAMGDGTSGIAADSELARLSTNGAQEA